MKPLVSVCVLTWNHEKYILQCLSSIVEQDYPELEIILVDNCSVDNTIALAEDFLIKCGRPFRISKNEVPKSVPANCNQMLDLATSDYVCLMSGDDWMHARNVSLKLEKMLEDELIAVVYSEMVVYIDDEDKMVAERGDRRFEGEVFDELIKGNFIAAPGSLVDRKKVKEVGGYNESIPIEDWDLWLRISQKFKVGFVDQFLVYYRRHSTNMSNPFSPNYIKSLHQVIDQYKEHANYKYCKQQIVYMQFHTLCNAKPTLKNIWEMLRIQDGTIYRLNVLKHSLFGRRKK
jgi:alpha-1,3-rhamnosyltransferase